MLTSAALSDRAFLQKCATPNQEHCTSMPHVLHAYAEFHKRMFAPETRCEDRRILVVRESFKDVVGVGHMRMGLHRFMAIALIFGRAVVFSTCASPDDQWKLRPRQLFKAAHPYNCSVPHLDPAAFYVGFGGIDMRWTPARRQLLQKCNISETTLDLNAKKLPKATTKRMCGLRWKGCNSGWNQDQMECDVRAKAHCPDLFALFEEGERADQWSKAPLLALYNARRDAGFVQAPRWQMAVGNGAASVASPNGSTLGIATDAALRDSLTCSYRCWSHVNFMPSPTVRAMIDKVVTRFPSDKPILCAHMRTMWVDDHRCFPNPRGKRRSPPDPHPISTRSPPDLHPISTRSQPDPHPIPIRSPPDLHPISEQSPPDPNPTPCSSQAATESSTVA